MPIYSYECPSCGTVHDRQKPIADRATDPCTCGAVADKMVSASGFSLKGEGWARDGYAKSPTAADYKAGKLSKQAMSEIPVVGRDGRLRSKDGKVIAG